MRQTGIRVRRVKPLLGRLRVSRLYVLGCLLVNGLAYGAETTVPEHATPAQFGSGWTCNSGYRKVARRGRTPWRGSLLREQRLLLEGENRERDG